MGIVVKLRAKKSPSYRSDLKLRLPVEGNLIEGDGEDYDGACAVGDDKSAFVEVLYDGQPPLSLSLTIQDSTNVANGWTSIAVLLDDSDLAALRKALSQK